MRVSEARELYNKNIDKVNVGDMAVINCRIRDAASGKGGKTPVKSIVLRIYKGADAIVKELETNGFSVERVKAIFDCETIRISW